MPSFDMSYIAILRDVARTYSLPYVSAIYEVVEDGSHIYGLEVDFPIGMSPGVSHPLFFWADPAVDQALVYEAAALQALIALQRIYGVLVVDYGIHGLHMYRVLAQHLFPVANRGTQLARLVIAASQHQTIPLSALVVSAQQLLDEVGSIADCCAL